VYLKSLTLKGFKSFADRTHMTFDPGLTVIVGPNGSGKSNISDAILWVLGEQSAKHLRGQAMEDIVFAGSSARNPVSVAEVTLVLDNTDHTLPVDFSDVAITRRMYRSGESEYLINGSPARLLDIQDILHDSGLGKETHSIISQGKLDEILMSRPEERRALIEEAAGISKHKRRRERAARKIDAMDERLKSVARLQRELNRQIRPLEKQVELAKRYQGLRGRADELSIELAVDDLRMLQERWGQAQAAEQAANESLTAAQDERARLESKLAALDERLKAANAASENAFEQSRRAQSLADRLSSLQRLLDQKARTMRTRVQDLNATWERSQERIERNAQELESARQDLIDARSQQADLRRRSDQAQEDIQAARTARRKIEDELSGVNAKSRARQKERDQASVALAKARDAADSAREQEELLAASEKNLEDSIAHAQAEAESARTRAADNDAAVTEARKALKACQDALASARNAADQAHKNEAEAQSELSSARAEIDGLERAAHTEENRTPLASRLAADPSAASGVVARVSERLEVPEELTGLVENLLADRLRGFVVSDDEDALLKVASAAMRLDDAAGQVTIVSASNTQAEDDEGESGLAGYSLAQRLSSSDSSRGLAYALLGDVRVVDTIQEAIAASKGDRGHTYVTVAGERVERGSQVIVGHPGDVTHGLLAGRRRLRELREGLDGLVLACTNAQEERQRCEQDLDQARLDADRTSQDLARLTGEAQSLSSEASRAQRALEEARAELERVRIKRGQTSASAQSARENAEQLEGAIQEADSALSALEKDAAALNERLDAARRDERRARDAGGECQVSSARLQERLRHLDERINQLSRESSNLEAEANSARAELASLRAKCQRLDPLAALLSVLAQQALGLQAELARKESVAGDGVEQLRASVSQARESVSAAQSAQAKALEELSDVKVTKGRLDEQVSNAVKAITSRRGVILEEALKIAPPQDRQADEAELARIEAQIEALGPINQIAFEQYQQLKERVDYVNAQVEDVQRARSSLAKIIGAIDRKMRRGFLETFDKVNENFTQIFSMLFPGGNGYLEMTDPENPSETGIEVIAQPRGKHVTKMSLLSGGERSLTALCLLFAVYRARTVPFYVLDEVEAALDDSNLDKLLAAIDALRTSTQLIVISHQRRTMERADVLYGVSMQADGVSHVVSQRLDQAYAPDRAGIRASG
jgi:chromosome segregation protein